MVRDAAREYSQSKLLPRVRKAYQEEKFDVEIMREMGEQGFLGCTSTEYGLPGVSSVAYGNLFRMLMGFFRINKQGGRTS